MIDCCIWLGVLFDLMNILAGFLGVILVLLCNYKYLFYS